MVHCCLGAQCTPAHTPAAASDLNICHDRTQHEDGLRAATPETKETANTERTLAKQWL